MPDVIIKDKNNQVVESSKNLLWAILAAVGCALFGMAVWIGLAAVNFYSAWMAITIVWLAKFGYDRAKGPNTMAKFLSILIITIIVLLLSEYVSLYIKLLLLKLNPQNAEQLVGLNFWTTLPYTFKYIGTFLMDLIFYVIFALLGSVSSLVLIYKTVKKNKSRVSVTNFNESANDEYEQKFNEFLNDGKDKFDE